MATKSNELTLNGKKKEMAETLASPDFNGNITNLCAKIGVARSTFYKWLDDKVFVAYINELIDKFTDSELSSVWKSLIYRAKDGDVQAIKLYFELKGKYKTTVDVNANSLVQIVTDIGDVIDDDDG